MPGGLLGSLLGSLLGGLLACWRLSDALAPESGYSALVNCLLSFGGPQLADLPVQALVLNFPAHNGPGRGFVGLKSGQIISAQVTGRNENGMTVLQWGGRQVPVNFPNPPPIGSILTLEVKQTPKGVQLVLLDTQPPNAAGAKMAASASQNALAPNSSPKNSIASNSGPPLAPGNAPAANSGRSAASGSAPAAGQTGASVPPSAAHSSSPLPIAGQSFAAQSAAATSTNPPNPTPPPAAAPGLPAVVVQTVVTAMASQNSAAALIANLIKLGEKPRDLPPQVRSAIGALKAGMLNAESAPKGETLARALLNSGTFLEAKLVQKNQPEPLGQPHLRPVTRPFARTEAPPSARSFAQPSAGQSQSKGPATDTGLKTLDIKAVLLDLERALKQWAGPLPARPFRHPPHPPERGSQPRATPLNSPGPEMDLDGQSLDIKGMGVEKSLAQRLLGQTEEALARLRLLQVASLPEHGPGKHAASGAHRAEWHMEVPMLFGAQAGMVHFQMEREPKRGGGTEKEIQRWRVRLAFTAGSMGPVSADIRLAGHEVGISVWAEQAAAGQFLHERLEDLRAGLIASGLSPTALHIRRPSRDEAAPAQAGHYLDLGT